MKFTKKRIFLIALVFVAIALGIVVEFILPRMFVVPHRSSSTQTPTSFTAFDVITQDKLTLKCWFIPSAIQNPKGTVIILHGWCGCKGDVQKLSGMAVDHGYNAISFDSRGHGQSGGTCCTFGFKEKEDLSALITQARQQFKTLGPVAVLGVSYGGAVAAQGLAHDPRIRCGILISSFCRLEDVARVHFKAVTHTNCDWLLRRVLKNGEQLAGFNVQDVQPTESAKSIQQPVLVIHGEDDPLVPLKDAEALFAHIPSTGKEWYMALATDHNRILEHKPLPEHVLAFLAKWMR